MGELEIKLDAFQKNENLMQAFASAESKESALRILNDNGVALSQNEFDQAIEFASKMKETGGEITDDDLQNVSGGLIVFPLPLTKFLYDWIHRITTKLFK